MADISGVLLAGGKSRRMGQDKRFIEIGGKTLVERGLTVLEKLFSEILIVVAEPIPQIAQYGHRIVTDIFPGSGSLGGLYTGLSHASNLRIFSVGCDMPFLDPTVVGLIAALDRGADIIIPRLATGLQPMHAVYSKKCLSYLEGMITARNFRLHELIGVAALTVRVVNEEEIRPIDPHLLSFINVNRPADLELACKVHAFQKGKFR